MMVCASVGLVVGGFLIGVASVMLFISDKTLRKSQMLLDEANSVMDLRETMHE